jgi:hypothetical protein
MWYSWLTPPLYGAEVTSVTCKIRQISLTILVRIAVTNALVSWWSCFIAQVLFFLSWHKKNPKTQDAKNALNNGTV